jgi:hypothetical protein
MIRFRFLPTLTLLSLSSLAFGAAGCSNGQSPTEPTFDPPAATKSLPTFVGKRHGADDPAGDDRGGQGQGADDPAGDNRGGRQGRGADDPAGDDHGGRGNGGQQGNQQQRPPRAVEREGAVASVDTAAGTLTLAGGQKITVNGQTQWNRRGDLLSLQQVADAVAAGKPTRAEARGTLQSGVLLAQTIKAEVGRR